MFDKKKILAELEEQRCLIEQQQVEIQRQRHQVRLLRQLTVAMQGELDALRGVIQTTPQPAPRRPGHGNALPERRPDGETMSSSD